MLRICVTCALALAMLRQSAAQKPDEQLPTFRTGVDVVELDVTVLDKDRHPVRGLTAEDFTILDRGKPQPIVAFSVVDVPAPVSYPAAWMREAPLDVVSNTENRRLVTIVMDDAYTDFNPDMAKRAKLIARNAVDELGPADLAAVVFTFMGNAQNFTPDRSRLLAAIDSYVPKRRNGEPPLPCWGPRQLTRGAPAGFSSHTGSGTRKCDTEALAAAAETLSTASPGRKVVIFISGGREFNFTDENEAADLSKLFRDLQRANITVYAFDSRGLAAPNGSMSQGLTAPGSTFSANESLYTFAANTGGRVVVNTNDPQSQVSQVFRESSSYYFIGFRPTVDSNDKGLRKVEVKVNRTDVQVQTRTGYYPPGKSSLPRDVVNGLPSGDLAVHATTSVVAVPGRRTAELILAARVDVPVSPPTARTVELAALAMDLDGKPKASQRQTITVTPSAASEHWPDLPAHLPLAPGRYIVQVSAKSEDRTGGVAVDVDVPDFAKDPLTASGLMLNWRPAVVIADKTLADLIPFLPTTVRQFHTGDDVGVFVRIYRGGKDRIEPVRMSATVRNEKGAVSSNYESTLEPANFSEARSADYDVSLPLAHLSAGEYLLEIVAQSGTRRVTRTARFSVAK